MKRVDLLIVGGGFYGLYLAEYFAAQGRKVVLCEKEPDLMQRASLRNQARVHNGYHYPRSLLTALRSRINFPRFVGEFEDCIDDEFHKLYAIGRRFSKVSATEFLRFMKQIEAPIEVADDRYRNLFNSNYIEEVFTTREYAFNAEKLKTRMRERAEAAGAELWTDSELRSIVTREEGGFHSVIARPSGEDELGSQLVFNCTYSMINVVLERAGLPMIPLKHEMAEMALVKVPEELADVGITVMCGPFFSCMPFPSKPGLHTLSHVRYTPHFNWHDTKSGSPRSHNAETVNSAMDGQSSFQHMLYDARRYLPLIEGCTQHGSLWEVKTVLPRSEIDDSRPILCRSHHGAHGFFVVMGGKIDNIYDVVEQLEETDVWG